MALFGEGYKKVKKAVKRAVEDFKMDQAMKSNEGMEAHESSVESAQQQAFPTTGSTAETFKKRHKRFEGIK